MDVAATQSVKVRTLKPFSYALRIVDSTQQLVRNPPSATFLMPLLRRMKSRFVEANVSSPRLPSTTMSPACGVTSGEKSAPHEPLTNAFESTTPLRIPYG